MQNLSCVLLVDDDEVTNFVHESLIEEMNITEQILTASNGQQALSVVQREELKAVDCSSLILLDINMPVMNGFEFLRAYRQLEEAYQQAVVVIMVTSSLNPKDIKQAEEAGVDAFIDKPLTKDKLQQVLDKHFS